MSVPDRERRDELANLYALGALTDAEQTELAQLTAGDPAFAADVRALEGVVAALGGSVPQIDPPAALRSRVLAAVTGSVPAPLPSDVTPLRRAVPSRSTSTLAWLAAAASLVTAAGLGLWAWQLQDRVREMDVRLNEAEREVVTVRQTLGQARDEARILKAQAQVFLAPDVKMVYLAGQPGAPGASARAYWSRRSGMVFAAASLPPLPADKVYQVWVVAEAQPPISAGLLRPDAQGAAYETFKTPQDIPTPKVVAVTLEPEGGVPQPTGDKVLVGLTGL
jgi:anti-sigma-K factor RskA